MQQTRFAQEQATAELRLCRLTFEGWQRLSARRKMRNHFGETIYVLHCFQKKTQKTSTADLETATRRYKELQKENGQ